MQSAWVWAPGFLVVLPSGQLKQAEEPGFGWNAPLTHGKHSAGPVGLYDPGAQGTESKKIPLNSFNS